MASNHNSGQNLAARIENWLGVRLRRQQRLLYAIFIVVVATGTYISNFASRPAWWDGVLGAVVAGCFCGATLAGELRTRADAKAKEAAEAARQQKKAGRRRAPAEVEAKAKGASVTPARASSSKGTPTKLARNSSDPKPGKRPTTKSTSPKSSAGKGSSPRRPRGRKHRK